MSRIVWVAKDLTMTPYVDDGMHLDTIKPPETPANCGWAEDGKTLCITARASVHRIKLAVAGEKPLYQ